MSNTPGPSSPSSSSESEPARDFSVVRTETQPQEQSSSINGALEDPAFWVYHQPLTLYNVISARQKLFLPRALKYALKPPRPAHVASAAAEAECGPSGRTLHVTVHSSDGVYHGPLRGGLSVILAVCDKLSTGEYKPWVAKLLRLEPPWLARPTEDGKQAGDKGPSTLSAASPAPGSDGAAAGAQAAAAAHDAAAATATTADSYSLSLPLADGLSDPHLLLVTNDQVPDIAACYGKRSGTRLSCGLGGTTLLGLLRSDEHVLVGAAPLAALTEPKAAASDEEEDGDQARGVGTEAHEGTQGRWQVKLERCQAHTRVHCRLMQLQPGQQQQGQQGQGQHGRQGGQQGQGQQGQIEEEVRTLRFTPASEVSPSPASSSPSGRPVPGIEALSLEVEVRVLSGQKASVGAGTQLNGLTGGLAGGGGGEGRGGQDANGVAAAAARGAQAGAENGHKRSSSQQQADGAMEEDGADEEAEGGGAAKRRRLDCQPGGLANGVAGVSGSLANGVAGVSGSLANGVAGVSGSLANGVAGVSGSLANGIAPGAGGHGRALHPSVPHGCKAACTLYCFMYDNDRRMAKEYVLGFTCSLCGIRCRGLAGLQQHLDASHPFLAFECMGRADAGFGAVAAAASPSATERPAGAELAGIVVVRVQMASYCPATGQLMSRPEHTVSQVGPTQGQRVVNTFVYHRGRQQPVECPDVNALLDKAPKVLLPFEPPPTLPPLPLRLPPPPPPAAARTAAQQASGAPSPLPGTCIRGRGRGRGRGGRTRGGGRGRHAAQARINAAAAAAPPISLRERQYYHSRTAMPMTIEEAEDGVDTDDEQELDEYKRHFKVALRQHSSANVTRTEAELMLLWNCFTRVNPAFSDSITPSRVVQFVELHGAELRRMGGAAARRSLSTFLMALWDYALVDAATVTQCLKLYDATEESEEGSGAKKEEAQA